MIHEITGYDETVDCNQNEQMDDTDATPPLCLVHYFVESGAYPPEPLHKPPGVSQGRVVERTGNLIILEFAPPPESLQEKWQKKRRAERLQTQIISRLFLLLLLLSALGYFIAARP